LEVAFDRVRDDIFGGVCVLVLQACECEDAVHVLELAMTLGVQLVMSLSVLIIALGTLTIIIMLLFRILIMLKRGVISSLGLVMAALGVWMELAH
jgi:hypothetical protein